MIAQDTEVLRRILKSGNAKTELAPFEADARQRYTLLFNKFAKGNLFTAQRMGPHDWLADLDASDDLQRWLDFDADACVAGVECRDYFIFDPAHWREHKRPDNYDAAYWNVRDFADQFCLRTGRHRKELFDRFVFRAKANGRSEDYAMEDFTRAWKTQRQTKGWEW